MPKMLKSIVIWAITLEAKLILRKYRPRVIAVTGSVGKTSAKDAIYSVFSQFFFVRKSEKSFNSEIGLPLTIIGAPNGWHNPFVWFANLLKGLFLIAFRTNYPKWLVLEIGADRPGDIEKISKWLVSDMAVITRLAKVPVHVEFFASPEAVVAEKSKILNTLKDGGILILNADDEDVLTLKESYRGEAFGVGFIKGASLRASHYKINYAERDGQKIPQGITFKVDHESNSLPVDFDGSLGRQHVYPLLFALAAAKLQNVNLVDAALALRRHHGPNGRMKLISGIKGSVIIDDTYNSSPVAVEEALQTLKDIETGGKKAAILGDMLELGKYSTEEHKKAGALAAQVCQLLITVGVRARDIALGALSAGMDEKNIFQYETAADANREMDNLIKEKDAILVKGSQGIRLEKVVEEIMAEPARAKELLARQDNEWKNR